MDRRSLIFVIALVIALFFINLWFSSQPKPHSIQPKKPLESIKEESNVPMESISSPAISKSSTEEEYFVLENDYQQIVFSNIGGSISEINLPFQSKENPKSFVR